MTERDAAAMPLWGKVSIVIAAILLIIVAAMSIDLGDDDGPDRPNLIGFDETSTR